jgi:hypothetical protein
MWAFAIIYPCRLYTHITILTFYEHYQIHKNRNDKLWVRSQDTKWGGSKYKEFPLGSGNVLFLVLDASHTYVTILWKFIELGF